MNRLFSLVLLVAVTGPGCSKSSVKNTSFPGSFKGKWIFTEQFYSTGGPGQWKAVYPANQFIEFKANSSIESTVSFLSKVNNYIIIDSTRLRFLPSPQPSVFSLMRYKIDSLKGELILSPLDLICIEGCAYKFRRVSR